jgi:hypothetical protein
MSEVLCLTVLADLLMNSALLSRNRIWGGQMAADSTRASRASHDQLRVCVVASNHDELIVRQITEFLSSVGIVLVSSHSSSGEVDVAVVLLSLDADYEAMWQQVTKQIRARRVVPVRVGDLRSDVLPKELQEIQWINWKPQAISSFYGSLLAVLQSNPDRLHSARELVAEAESWLKQGHPDSMLIQDVERAIEANSLLTEMQNDSLTMVSKGTQQFVARSLIVARVNNKKKRRRRILAVVAVLFAFAIGVPAYFHISNLSQSNGQSFVTSGEINQPQLSEWTALLSGALLIDGSPGQKSLARQTLLGTLDTSSWGLGPVDAGPGYAVDDEVPTSKSGQFDVLIGKSNGNSQLRMFTVHTGQWSSMLPLGGTFWYADSLDGGRKIAVAGPSGVAFVSLPSREVEHVKDNLSAVDARMSTKGVLSVVTDKNEIYTVSPIGDSRLIGHFQVVLDLERTSSGDVNALVENAPGVYEILNTENGEVLAKAVLPPSVVAEGGLSPYGDVAYVAGADDQLWSLSKTAIAAPTGIPVSDRTNVIHILSGDRIVVGGTTETADVYYLPTGAILGQVCTDTPRLLEVRSFMGSSVIACQGGALTTFWNAPSGPDIHSPSDMSSQTDVQHDGLSITTLGGSIRFQFSVGGGKHVTSRWTSLFPYPIVASVISPNATQAMVATSSGEVAIFNFASTRVQVASLWTVPGHVGAQSVGFVPHPTVLDKGGNAWSVPNCVNCNVDEGLLAQLHDRLSGCWLNHQLTNVSKAVQSKFDIQLCRPLAAPIGT